MSFSEYLKSVNPYHIQWKSMSEIELSENGRPLLILIGSETDAGSRNLVRGSFTRTVANCIRHEYTAIAVDADMEEDWFCSYASASRAVNGSAVLPLLILALPNGNAFFCGGYIGPEDTKETAGMQTLLSVMAEKYRNSADQLKKIARDIADAVRRLPIGGRQEVSSNICYAQLASVYDKEYGGFGSGAKLPNTGALIFLMRYGALKGNRMAKEIIENSLRQMYRGGLKDHFGDGFFDFTLDREWLTPVFRKSLAGNAQMAIACVEAWKNGHFELYRRMADSALSFCRNELFNGSAYASSINDLSGTHYLFTPDEVKQILGEETGRHFAECYDITAEGNLNGKSIPNLLLNNRWQMLPEGYDTMCVRMGEARRAREGLLLNEKVLLGENALLLSAFAKAYAAFGRPEYLEYAKQLHGVLQELAGENGVYAAQIKGVPAGTACLRSVALYGLSLLDLYDADLDAQHILEAIAVERMIRAMFGAESLYSDIPSHSKAPAAAPDIYDAYIASGNSLMCELFARLSRLTGASEYRKRCVQQIERMSGYCTESPAGCAAFASELCLRECGTKELVFVSAGTELPEALLAVSGRYSPDMTILLKNPETEAALSAAAVYTGGMKIPEQGTEMYLCSNGKAGPAINTNL